jgi:hypothetical protein
MPTTNHVLKLLIEMKMKIKCVKSTTKNHNFGALYFLKRFVWASKRVAKMLKFCPIWSPWSNVCGVGEKL